MDRSVHLNDMLYCCILANQGHKTKRNATKEARHNLRICCHVGVAFDYPISMLSSFWPMKSNGFSATGEASGAVLLSFHLGLSLSLLVTCTTTPGTPRLLGSTGLSPSCWRACEVRGPPFFLTIDWVLLCLASSSPFLAAAVLLPFPHTPPHTTHYAHTDTTPHPVYGCR
jgi:hypothetical protein